MMTEIALPKWPCLIVKGKPVTKDQAKEILIRTSGLFFCSNDDEFEKLLNQEIYGVACRYLDVTEALMDKHGLDTRDAAFNLKEKLIKPYKILELNYIVNRQILSSYIGGPHGWCDWGGYIGCNTYNIGKWPSVSEVENDWSIIAEAFPYLDLRCQLLSGESCEENIVPVVEYVVKDGKVKIVKPTELLDYPKDNMMQNVMSILSPNRERGCTISMFKDALAYVKNKYNGKQKIKTR